MTVILAPLWEIWNWSDGDVTFFGVVLLLYAAYGLGYGHALRGGDDRTPNRVYLAGLAFSIGIVMLIAANADSGCELGECERPGP